MLRQYKNYLQKSSQNVGKKSKPGIRYAEVQERQATESKTYIKGSVQLHGIEVWKV